jgi:hypothetical protein
MPSSPTGSPPAPSKAGQAEPGSTRRAALRGWWTRQVRVHARPGDRRSGSGATGAAAGSRRRRRPARPPSRFNPRAYPAAHTGRHARCRGLPHSSPADGGAWPTPGPRVDLPGRLGPEPPGPGVAAPGTARTPAHQRAAFGGPSVASAAGPRTSPGPEAPDSAGGPVTRHPRAVQPTWASATPRDLVPATRWPGAHPSVPPGARSAPPRWRPGGSSCSGRPVRRPGPVQSHPPGRLTGAGEVGRPDFWILRPRGSLLFRNTSSGRIGHGCAVLTGVEARVVSMHRCLGSSSRPQNVTPSHSGSGRCTRAPRTSGKESPPRRLVAAHGQHGTTVFRHYSIRESPERGVRLPL